MTSMLSLSPKQEICWMACALISKGEVHHVIHQSAIIWELAPTIKCIIGFGRQQVKTGRLMWRKTQCGWTWKFITNDTWSFSVVPMLRTWMFHGFALPFRSFCFSTTFCSQHADVGYLGAIQLFTMLTFEMEHHCYCIITCVLTSISTIEWPHREIAQTLTWQMRQIKQLANHFQHPWQSLHWYTLIRLHDSTVYAKPVYIWILLISRTRRSSIWSSTVL